MDQQAFREDRLATGTDLSIYYRLYGTEAAERTPLLCLPGYWRNCRDYEVLGRNFSDQRRVISPDMRGRGQSSYSENTDDYLFDRLVEDVIRLLDSLGVERVAIAGTTLGALMALDLANRHPERVAGILFNDCGPEKAQASVKRQAAYATSDDFTFDEVVALIKAQNEGFIKGLDEDGWTRMVLRAYRRNDKGRWQRDFDLNTNVATARQMTERPTFWAEYAAARDLPLAVLRGEHSDYLPPEILDRMVGEAPGLAVTIVKDRGHPPLLEEPQVIQAVARWLERVDAAK